MNPVCAVIDPHHERLLTRGMLMRVYTQTHSDCCILHVFPVNLDEEEEEREVQIGDLNCSTQLPLGLSALTRL